MIEIMIDDDERILVKYTKREEYDEALKILGGRKISCYLPCVDIHNATCICKLGDGFIGA